ncbi:unnamed protein product [Prorocentrum cordatum]|uniref:Uncharacterized protein n=1 Tax=Prorocentrum cordatum TaxID=2364126 RepID=A0ABN9T1J4_9DINO|nr:unnamed protein product [Polarella glacialis]
MPHLWTERYQPGSEAELVVTKRKVELVREFLVSGAQRGQLEARQAPGRRRCSGACAATWGSSSWSGARRRGARRRRPRGATPPRATARSPVGQSCSCASSPRTDRYRGLAAGGAAAPARRPRVTLVRDFPHTLLSARGSGPSGSGDFLGRFHSAVQGGSLQRAVFCFNDSYEEDRTIRQLLGRAPSEAHTMIYFDTVAKTFVQKALDAVSRAEGHDPKSLDTAALALECGGDLRHAINALQLAAGSRPPSGAPPRAAGRGRARGRGRGRDLDRQPSAVSEGAAADSGGVGAARLEPPDRGLRRASLGLFHALGRLLYCKRLPPPGGLTALSQDGGSGPGRPPAKRRRGASAGPAGCEAEAGPAPARPEQLPHHLLVPKSTRPPLYFVPEDVVAASNCEPSTLVDWLFTNAPRFCGDVGDLALYASSLAETDAWSRGAGSPWLGGTGETDSFADSLRISVQVRSLLDANLHPVPPTFADPCGGEAVSAQAASFNMARPLLRDALRHRQRRAEELAGHLGADPATLGARGPAASIRMLPYVHQMLASTKGRHPALRQLPHPLMRLIKELSSPIDSELLRTGMRERESGGPPEGSGRAAVGAEAPAPWAVALEDDPIEDS